MSILSRRKLLHMTGLLSAGIVGIPSLSSLAKSVPASGTSKGVTNPLTYSIQCTELYQDATGITSQIRNSWDVEQSSFILDFAYETIGINTGATLDSWIGFKHQDTYDKYSVHFLLGSCELRRRLNGVITTLGSVAMNNDVHVPHTMRVVTTPSSVDVFLLDNPAQPIHLFSIADSSLPTGPQLVMYTNPGTHSYWDYMIGKPF